VALPALPPAVCIPCLLAATTPSLFLFSFAAVRLPCSSATLTTPGRVLLLATSGGMVYALPSCCCLVLPLRTFWRQGLFAGRLPLSPKRRLLPPRRRTSSPPAFLRNCACAAGIPPCLTGCNFSRGHCLALLPCLLRRGWATTTDATFALCRRRLFARTILVAEMTRCSSSKRAFFDRATFWLSARLLYHKLRRLGRRLVAPPLRYVSSVRFLTRACLSSRRPARGCLPFGRTSHSTVTIQTHCSTAAWKFPTLVCVTRTCISHLV